jgi:hypothetical protein
MNTLPIGTPSKHALLAQLTRDELLAVADRIGLVVPARSAKEDLLHAIISLRRATLHEILPVLSRERVMRVCRGLGLEVHRPKGCVVGE